MTGEWIRFALSALCILAGLCVFFIAVFGVYRYRYVLNRMHTAALGDTLGILFVILGLCVATGVSLTTLKLLIVVAAMWMTSPVSSHLISRLEVTTNENIAAHCPEYALEQLEEESKNGDL